MTDGFYLEELLDAQKMIARLRDELESQWTDNHLEHCRSLEDGVNGPICMLGDDCHRPRPVVLDQSEALAF